MEELPHLPPKKSLNLLKAEEQSILTKIRNRYDPESTINYGDVQEFYFSAYNILWRCFGKEHRVVANFQNLIGLKYDSQYYKLQALLGAIRSAEKEIQNAIDHPNEMKILYTSKNLDQNPKKADFTNNRKIFVVHGRNNQIKNELCDFLIKIETEPIILEEQVIVGKTVLDQFEYYADICSFAVVLMTGDDFGGANAFSLTNIFTHDLNEEKISKIDNIKSNIETRARQNVITELGYFWGHLGLDRVRVLYEEGVIKPSDIDAIMYIKLDTKRSWKWKMARELDQKGIKIDMSLLDPLED